MRLPNQKSAISNQKSEILRPTRAEINLSALRQNFAIARSLTGGAKLLALVKAEAYGHGLLRMAQEFAALGADYLGVSFLEEGLALREAGLDVPILVMGGLVDEQVESYLDYDLELTVSSVWKARQVEEVAERRNKKAIVHLKVDTGMGRIGQQWNSAGMLFAECARLRHLEFRGLYTHLATAESADLTFARTQLDRFNEVIESARMAGIEPPLIHAANSGAILQLPDESRFTMVRPGILLYGYPPSSHLRRDTKNQKSAISNQQSGIAPVMTLRSQVVYVKKPTVGTTIGYGATWATPGGKWIATLPIGYGDGYPRRAGNRGWVMLRGRRCPIVGVVSMDQMTVDAGEDGYLGDEAILFGGKGDNALDLWELSQALDAIPYELMTSLTARVPRAYLNQA